MESLSRWIVANPQGFGLLVCALLLLGYALLTLGFVYVRRYVLAGMTFVGVLVSAYCALVFLVHPFN